MVVDPNVQEILRQLELTQYVEVFADNAIDRSLLASLTDADLKELGVAALGHRKRLLTAFAEPANGAKAPVLRDGLAEEELKIATVFFADITGSTSRIQGLDPEDAAAVLRPYLALAANSVRTHGGTVLQELGDGLMAVFGAPLAIDDHAKRACHAALNLQSGVADLARRKSDVSALQMRVGLHSGEVLVSGKGQTLKVSGPAVHLAARMEQSAQPGKVQLSSATKDLIDDAFLLSDASSVMAKGFARPIEAYALLAASDPKARLVHKWRRQLVPLVARQREIERLTDAARAAGSGCGGIVAIVGAPGLGKSRLVHEFGDSESLSEFRVVRGYARPDEAERAFGLVIELVMAFLEIVRSVEIQASLLPYQVTLPAAVPALQALLGVPIDDSKRSTLDATVRQARITDAVVALLMHQSGAQPIAIIVEDLHWADDGSRAVLTGLANLIRRQRLLLVISYRPEFTDPWVNLDGHALIKLAPLSDPEISELLALLIGSDATVQPLKDILRASTGGNPLFIEEYVRGMRENGTIESLVGGDFRLTRPLSEIEVPRSIQSMIAVRVDAQPRREREVLQVAAVVGATFALQAVACLLDADESELAFTLAALQRADFVHEASRIPQPTYEFKHALTRETVYRQILKSRRRELHGQMLKYLEDATVQGVEADVEALAYHSLHGELWGKCLAYSQQAANRSWLGLMERVAAKYLEWAITSVDWLEPSLENLQLAIDLRLDLRGPLNGTGQIERLESVMVKARDLAGQLNDKWRQAAATGHLSLAFWRSGKFDAAEAEGCEALRQANDLDDNALRALAWFRIGQSRHGRGDYQGAVTAFEFATSFGPEGRTNRGLPSWRAAGSGPLFLAWSLVEAGHYDRGAEIASEVQLRARSQGDRRDNEMASFVLGLGALKRGNFDRALLEVSDAVAERLKLADAGYLAWTGSVAGLALAGKGEFDRAFRSFGHAMQIAGRNRALQYQFPFAFLGEAYLLAGRVSEARSTLEETLAWCRRRGEHGTEEQCLALLSRCHVLSGDENGAALAQ